jgi:tetratricopeptide (TPR) repeat protein
MWIAALALCLQDADEFVRQGDEKMARNFLAEAKADYDNAIGKDPKHGRAYLQRAKLLTMEKKWHLVIEDSTRAIELLPGNAEPHILRAGARMARMEFDKAIPDYDKAIELKPKDGELLLNRGIARAKKRDLVPATEDFTKAIELGVTGAYPRRAEARSMLRQYKEAIADYDKAIELKPEETELYVGRGRTKHDADEPDGGVADLLKALELQPGNGVAFLYLCEARAKKKDWDGLIGDMTKRIESNPKDSKAYHERGRARLQKGDSEGAIADQTKAIEISRGFLPAYIARAEAYEAGKSPDKALGDYDFAVSIDPKSKYVLSQRAQARRRMGKFMEAIDDYSALIRMNPLDAQRYVDRAMALWEMGEITGAEQDLNSAVRLKESESTLLPRGAMRFANGLLDSAAKDLSEGCRRFPAIADRLQLFLFLCRQRMGAADAKDKLRAYAAERKPAVADELFPGLAALLLGDKPEEEILKAAGESGAAALIRQCRIRYYVAAARQAAGDAAGAAKLYAACVETGCRGELEFLCARTETSLIDNPAYTAWAAFKPGSQVVFGIVQESAGARMQGEATRTLKEFTSAKAVIEVRFKSMDGREGPAGLQEIPAKIMKSETAPKESEAELEIGEKKIMCRLSETTMLNEGQSQWVKIWWHDSIPGGVAMFHTGRGKDSQKMRALRWETK